MLVRVSLDITTHGTLRATRCNASGYSESGSLREHICFFRPYHLPLHYSDVSRRSASLLLWCGGRSTPEPSAHARGSSPGVVPEKSLRSSTSRAAIGGPHSNADTVSSEFEETGRRALHTRT
ncbi:hypothetical protein IEO21_03001 [Rhodonia placenta]|uniref:Uncharacterized protein n=1 Tax=Rhodonia placenta TaxID=104341 RepID=A0A8H7P6M6_9APHY|nr:hypothetical protein IEO21_03001 [Postia placenta]